MSEAIIDPSSQDEKEVIGFWDELHNHLFWQLTTKAHLSLRTSTDGGFNQTAPLVWLSWFDHVFSFDLSAVIDRLSVPSSGDGGQVRTCSVQVLAFFNHRARSLLNWQSTSQRFWQVKAIWINPISRVGLMYEILLTLAHQIVFVFTQLNGLRKSRSLRLQSDILLARIEP